MWIYSSREDKLTSVFILSFYLSSSSNRLYNCPASRGESLSFSLCICLFTYLPIAYIIVYLCLRVHCACTYTCIHLSIMYLYTYVLLKPWQGGQEKQQLSVPRKFTYYFLKIPYFLLMQYICWTVKKYWIAAFRLMNCILDVDVWTLKLFEVGKLAWSIDCIGY